MELSIGNTRIEIRFSFLLLMAIFLMRDINNMFQPILLAVVLHELGHYTVMRIFGVHSSGVVLSFTGIHIGRGGMFELPMAKEMAVHLAGPLVNLAVAGLCAVFLGRSMLRDYFVVINLLLAALHMLPVGTLDGANILRLVVHELFEDEGAETIYYVVSIGFLLLLLYMLYSFRRSVNFTFIFLWLYLLYVTLRR